MSDNTGAGFDGRRYDHGLVWTEHTFTCSLCNRLTFASTAAMDDLAADQSVEELEYCISCTNGVQMEGEHVAETFGRIVLDLVGVDRVTAVMQESGEMLRDRMVEGGASWGQKIHAAFLVARAATALLSDIEAMRTGENAADGSALYGPFDGNAIIEEPLEGEQFEIEWANLGISAARLRAALEGKDA